MTLMDKLHNRRFHIQTKDWPLEGWQLAAASEYEADARLIFRYLFRHPSVKEITLRDTWDKTESAILLRDKR